MRGQRVQHGSVPAGCSMAETEAATDRNNWMFGEEAREYGIVDHVI